MIKIPHFVRDDRFSLGQLRRKRRKVAIATFLLFLLLTTKLIVIPNVEKRNEES